MSEKIIAPGSATELAFRYNAQEVRVLYNLENPFIMPVEVGTPLLSLGSSIIKATEPGLFIPALSQNSLGLSKKQLKTRILGWEFDEIVDAVDFLMGDPSVVDTTVDPFTKTRNLELGWDGLLQSDGLFQIGENLFMQLGYIDDSCTISFQTTAEVLFDGVVCPVFAKSPYILSPYDTVSILFSDNSILEFNTIKKTSFCCILHQEDFDAFTQKSIDAIRITIGKGDMDAKSMEFENIFFGVFSFFALILYFRKYIAMIMEVNSHCSLPNRTIAQPNNNEQGNCFVYLMQDSANGYYKIGISNNPTYRERTLQSEKPSIEMIASKRFPNRKIAMAIESALHNTYSQQRVRGEWFNLTEADVAAIIETLK